MKKTSYFIGTLAFILLFACSSLANERYEKISESCFKIASGESRNTDIVVKSLEFLYLQETDKQKKQALSDTIAQLKSSKITINNFSKIISRINKNKIKAQSNRDIDSGNVSCATCGGGGIIDRGTSTEHECPACNGHGNVWSPDQAGHEKKCGRCSGNGKIQSGSTTMTCPKCKGSGWTGATVYPK